MTPRTTKLHSVPEETSKGAKAGKATPPEDARPRLDPAANVRLTADRILIEVPDENEQRSKGGLVIPATAATPTRRCVWSEVVLVGPEVRNVKVGDRVLFIPHAGLEVDVRGDLFFLLRERDVQAIASERVDPDTGQYL